MPYVFVSTQIRLECGPTICGDEQSDPELMHYLGATLTKQFGNNFEVYSSPEMPRIILDKLETCGYKVVSQSGAGQTMIWTLHKPLSPADIIAENSKEWRTDLLPRVVLDRLEAKGYKVISSTGMGQTVVWTLHRRNMDLADW